MNRRKAVQHGTLSGYHLELLRGMDTCDKCRAANAEYHRNYRKERKERWAEYARNMKLWEQQQKPQETV